MHHVVHHFLTFKKNHVTQFSSDEERNWLNSLLEARRGSDIIECKYGLVLGGRLKYYLMYMAPTLPLFILICGFGGIWFKIGACIPLCVWPTLAELVHPYLHAPYRHVIGHGPFAVRILARTAYFRYLAQHHWLHHRYTDCNYNLLLGGDYFLRAWRWASDKDLDEMRCVGLWCRAPGNQLGGASPLRLKEYEELSSL